MSVSSSLQQSTRTHGDEPDDSAEEEEWEIGVGDLIIDLDADLEKDRQTSEMNRVLSVKSAVEGRDELEYKCATGRTFDGLNHEQPFHCKETKKFKLKRRNSSNDRFASVEIVSGIPKACVGKRREAQGRGDMSSAPSPTDSSPEAAPARPKDGKKGKNKAVRREKESTKSRKEKPSDEFGGPATENGSAFGGSEGLVGRGGMDAAAIVDDAEEHSLRTLGVKTRSVGTNTQESEKALESSYMEPCQPGTSVNLEGIVWHETEEGVLVVNVTWRKRTYVGTLLDCTKHDWAPPRFCESPVSDSEMPCARGRGKRMRLAIPDQPNAEPSLSKMRGLTHKRRGVGIGNKGRRGSLNLSGCRTPGYYAVEDTKSSPLICGKRKSKAPADLDLTLVSEDIRNGNGKRIRAKSRSAPSTPQGKSDPVFLDQVCASPMLIDCPHPNCNKKYKHINGLRYHQSHAHLNNDSKQDFEVESEDRLSDFDEAINSVPFESSENIVSKKPRGMYKLNAAGSPKSRKALISNDSSSVANAKLRQNVVNKDASIDDLSNLPLISNMSVVLENCLMTDRNTSVEMPKLEAEGAIDKRDVCSKIKKDSGFTERCSGKSRNNRLVNAAPAPPKLTAIPPAAFSTKITEVSSHQASPTVSLTKAKNLTLKPIKPKLDVIAQVNMSNTTVVLSKDSKRKEKHRLKDRNGKDPRSPKSDLIYQKMEDTKSISKDFPVSLLKEHLSKQDVLNGPSETQESRMASIRAEADKVYTFSDNAPSPSIGSSARIDCGTLTNGDGATTKTNSPAYSDISDAGEDGEGKVEGVKVKTEDQSSRDGAKKALFPSQASSKESSYYPGYDNYYSPSYSHPSPGGATAGGPLPDGQAVKLKKEEEQELVEEKVKVDMQDERKAEVASSQPHQQQQASVIQQRSNMYMQPLYYNQYYVPQYGYPDQVYHNHLMNTNPTYRQQYEERQRLMAEQHRSAEKKPDSGLKDRESSLKEDWKQKGPVPPGLTKAPSLSDLGKPQAPGKQRDTSSEAAKSVIIPKGEETKLQPQQAEGLKMKLSEAGHHGKDDSKASVESARLGMEQAMWYRQYPDSQRPPDDDRERERDRKGKEERSRQKDSSSKEDNKDVVDVSCPPSIEDQRSGGKDPRPNPHIPFGSPLAQHQPYLHYMHGYPFGQSYDPNHPGYRGMSSMMNYPGSYLPAGYPFSPYGSKMISGEEGEKSRSSPTVSSKSASESKALDILHQHANQYKSKSPTVADKPSHERERGLGDRERERERDREREREIDRPRSSPSQRIMAPHHHLGYPLVAGQYDLSYATGLSSSAIVASQQASAPSLYPPARR